LPTNDVMSILGVAIVPPHPTVLSLRMAVAFYVTGISTPEVHLESPPLPGTLTISANATASSLLGKSLRVDLTSAAPLDRFVPHERPYVKPFRSTRWGELLGRIEEGRGDPPSGKVRKGPLGGPFHLPPT